MNYLQYLESNGIQVRLKHNGNLGLKGLSGLQEHTRSKLKEWARQHKAQIVKQLRQNEINELTNKEEYQKDRIRKKTESDTNETKKAFSELLARVGGYVKTNNGNNSLVFDPPLAGPEFDPKRWTLAGELEAMFHSMPVTVLDPDQVSDNCINPGRNARSNITKHMLSAWKAARPWLLARLPELQGHGWTRTSLFRAGQLKYPHGPWGVGFASNWLRPEVNITIDLDGSIRWTWTELSGREVSQASRPIK
jgi:hypothetical protein